MYASTLCSVYTCVYQIHTYIINKSYNTCYLSCHTVYLLVYRCVHATQAENHTTSNVSNFYKHSYTTKSQYLLCVATYVHTCVYALCSN